MSRRWTDSSPRRSSERRAGATSRSSPTRCSNASGDRDSALSFEATERLAAEQLAQRAARLTLRDLKLDAGNVGFDVVVENLTGHKFPTGHPSRRAWLRVRVRDSAGRVLFASGEHDAAGRILDSRGQPLASERAGSTALPHRTVIRTDGEVPVYELVMADARGGVTHSLMRAARSWKDNRLLPTGWVPDHPEAAATRPVGLGADRDFRAGVDVVTYAVRVPAGAPAATIEATLLYETLGARYAAELFRSRSPEVAELRRMLERSGNAPVVVAHQTLTIR